MKKKGLAGLLLVAPLTLLCACGGGTTGLTFSANWYSNTTTNNISGTEEILEYEVIYDSNEAEVTLSYDKGSFVTTLSDETLDGAQVYHLHTELHLSGSYTYHGSTAEFEDYTISDVWFMEARESLRPLRCEKEVHSTVPGTIVSSDELTVLYHYSYVLEYASDLSSATYTMDDLTTDKDEPTAETITLNHRTGTFLDNEQMYFALRGLDMSATASFNSIDPQTRQEVALSVPDVPTASTDPVSFEMNGTAVESIDTYHVSLRYSSSQPGPSRTLVYAARTSADNNTYRNVLVRMANPVLNSLGTLTYNLKKATFNNK